MRREQRIADFESRIRHSGRVDNSDVGRLDNVGLSGSDRRLALLYMIIEHFKNRDPVPVYRRFRDHGRMAPAAVQYVSSWVDENLERCFQLMEAEDRKHLDDWLANWTDIVEFEVYPVITSTEAAARISSRL